MQKKNLSKLNMSQTLISLLNGIDPLLLATIPMFVLWYTSFKNIINSITTEIEALDQAIQGFQNSRKAARAALIQAAADLATKIQSYATSIDDPVLFGNAAFAKSTLERLSAIDLKAVTQNIANLANANLLVLAPYNVTVLSMANYALLRTAFITADPKPKAAKQAKTAASVALTTALQNAMGFLKKMDGTMRTMRTTQLVLMQDYFRARKIVSLPTFINVAIGHITNTAGASMPYVNIFCKTLNLDRRATKKGRFTLKEGDEGMHDITFAFPGYKSVTKRVPIAHGLRANVLVVMVPLEEAID